MRRRLSAFTVYQVCEARKETKTCYNLLLHSEQATNHYLRRKHFNLNHREQTFTSRHL